jgi:hypothetical protein
VRHAPRPPRFLTAGLPGVLRADALVGEIADVVGLLVGLVQRLIAALLALLTVERVLRLVRQSSGIHAGLPSSECGAPPWLPAETAVLPLLHSGTPLTCLHDRGYLQPRRPAQQREAADRLDEALRW